MQAPPRRPDQKLFDRAVMARGLWQGAGLLLLLLATYAGASAWLATDSQGDTDTQREAVARALTFAVLILANLALIHSNRAWGRSTLLGHVQSNRPFAWIAVGTLLVLATVLSVPAIRQLFSFAAPPLGMLCAALGMVGLSLLWFEAVKHIQNRQHLQKAKG